MFKVQTKKLYFVWFFPRQRLISQMKENKFLIKFIIWWLGLVYFLLLLVSSFFGLAHCHDCSHFCTDRDRPYTDTYRIFVFRGGDSGGVGYDLGVPNVITPLRFHTIKRKGKRKKKKIEKIRQQTHFCTNIFCNFNTPFIKSRMSTLFALRAKIDQFSSTSCLMKQVI